MRHGRDTWGKLPNSGPPRIVLCSVVARGGLKPGGRDEFQDGGDSEKAPAPAEGGEGEAASAPDRENRGGAIAGPGAPIPRTQVACDEERLANRDGGGPPNSIRPHEPGHEPLL